MLNFRRYFAIIAISAISFATFSCEKSKNKAVPAPIIPYPNKLAIKINGEPIANATAVTATSVFTPAVAGISDATQVVTIKGVVGGKNITLEVQPLLGVGSTIRNINGVENSLNYVDGATNYAPIPARSTMILGYSDASLKVLKGEFEARLVQVGGTGTVQLSQCTFDIQYK